MDIALQLWQQLLLDVSAVAKDEQQPKPTKAGPTQEATSTAATAATNKEFLVAHDLLLAATSAKSAAVVTAEIAPSSKQVAAEQLSERLSSALEEVRKVKWQLAQQQDECTQKGEEVERLRSLVQQLTSRVGEFQQVHRLLLSQVAEAKSDSELCSRTATDLAQSQVVVNRELARKTATVSSMKASLQHANQGWEDARAEQRRLTMVIADHVKWLSSSRNALDEAQKSIRFHKDEIAEKNRHIEMLTTEHAKTLGLLARAIAVQQQPHDKMPEKKTPAPVAEMEVVVEAKQAEVDPTSVQVTTEVVAPFMVETLAVVPAPAAFEAPPTTEFVETIEAPAPPTPQAPLTAEAPQSLPPLPPSSPAEENTQNKMAFVFHPLPAFSPLVQSPGRDISNLQDSSISIIGSDAKRARHL